MSLDVDGGGPTIKESNETARPQDRDRSQLKWEDDVKKWRRMTKWREMAVDRKQWNRTTKVHQYKNQLTFTTL